MDPRRQVDLAVFCFCSVSPCVVYNFCSIHCKVRPVAGAQEKLVSSFMDDLKVSFPDACEALAREVGDQLPEIFFAAEVYGVALNDI